MKKIIQLFLFILTIAPLFLFQTPVYADTKSCASQGLSPCNTVGDYKRQCVSGTNNCTFKVWRCENVNGVRCLVPKDQESDCGKTSSDPDLVGCRRTSQGGDTQGPSNVEEVFGEIEAPPQVQALGSGESAITNVIQLIIQGIYTVSGIGFVVLFLWSVFKIITSQGDKEALMSARKTIQWAIIGLVLLAFAFPIMNLVGNILGFQFFG
jgi:hypothetical protein